MTKEGTDSGGEFLKVTPGAEEHLFQLILVLEDALGGTAFDVVSNLFVRVERRRIRRQKEEFEFALLRSGELLDPLGLMRRAPVDNG